MSGTVGFRGNLIHVFADSGNTVTEGNEANNYGNSAPPCTFIPSTEPFAARIKWEWTASPILPASRNVMMTPAVVDLDGDAVPDVVFSSFDNNWFVDGHVRAVSGRDGHEMFTVTDPMFEVSPGSPIAVGDIDADGKPEILVVHESWNHLIAFEQDGAFKWLSSPLESLAWGGAAIADLDGDGVPEIVLGRQVLNHDGTLRWTGNGGRAERADFRYGPLALVANLDMDGTPEIVAGNTAYRADGATYWQNNGIGDGYNAVGNFDEDPFPEIVLVSGGAVYLLEHTGVVKWGPVGIPEGGFGGPPTVADFDGDGQAEIGVAAAARYVVFETDGAIKWSSPTDDSTSNATGSSVFDFEGDGAAEVVYADQTKLRVYRGTDGTVLFETPNSSCTIYEYPVIADVDADGNAEIVAVANDIAHPICHFGPQHGIRVFGSANDGWVSTRRIWNQHTYHVGNVNDDGTIPPHESNSWGSHNTYRLQKLLNGCEHTRSDLVASFARKMESGDNVVLTARIGNAGSVLVGPGLPSSFYDGNPSLARLLGTAVTTQALRPGTYEDVSLTVPRVTFARPLWVVADDAGGGEGTQRESDEANNAYESPVTLSPTENEPPIVHAGLDAVVQLPSHTLILDGSVIDDGLPVGIVRILWTRVSGPCTVAFGTPAAEDTAATFTCPGPYVLRLTASDTVRTAFDEVDIVVSPRPVAGRTWTTNADFDLGRPSTSPTNLPTNSGSRARPGAFQFIWVAVSTKGTVVKIDTRTGQVLGEYRTAPEGQPTDRHARPWT